MCSSGSKLLSADGDGQIKCWAMTEHLVNSWECTQSSAVDGDPIVALSWLHNGVKLALHVEKVNTVHTVLFPHDQMSELPSSMYKIIILFSCLFTEAFQFVYSASARNQQ